MAFTVVIKLYLCNIPWIILVTEETISVFLSGFNKPRTGLALAQAVTSSWQILINPVQVFKNSAHLHEVLTCL